MQHTIGIIGGTGQLGKGLARRLAKAGHTVTIGSRTADRAIELGSAMGVSGAANLDAATEKEFVFVCVPYASQAATLKEIAPVISDAIVIDTSVPLMPPKVMRVQLPAAGSAAQEAQAHLGEGVRLVTAMHNVSAHILDSDDAVDCDVLTFSDDVPARTAVIDLIASMGIRALSGGVLANAAAAEALTSILIYMNKTYSAEGGAGVRFTGLVTAPAI